MQHTQLLTESTDGAQRRRRLLRHFALGLTLTTFAASGCECPGPTPDAGTPDCAVTFDDPRDGVSLTTAADDNDDNAANGIQYDVRLATDCPDGTSVTLFNEANGEEETATVSGTSLTFSDFTIDASENAGAENRLRAVASPTDAAVSEDIITVTGVDDGGNEDPTCSFTSPSEGDNVDDADLASAGFQIATSVQCENTEAGDEVRIQAGEDPGVTVSLDAAGTASAIVTSTEESGSIALLVFLVDDAAVNATINVNLGEERPDCDATILSPADGTVFGAGSPDQSADEGFQILVRVSTNTDCENGDAIVSIGGEEIFGTIGGNGEADVIVTIAEGTSTISASVSFEGERGAADTVNVTYEPGAIGMTFDVPACGTFGDGCFNAAVGDSAPATPTIEQNITVFAPAQDGDCPYTDPTITVDGGPSVGGATWTFNAGDDRCEATFANLTLTDNDAPDGVIVVLEVSASTNDGQDEVATFNLGIDFVPSAIDVQTPSEGEVLNQADDPNLGDGYQVGFQVLTPNLRDGAEVTVVFVSSNGLDDVEELCVVSLESCEVNASLGDGDWTATVTATDDALNVSTLVRTLTVDATLPIVTAIALSLDADDNGTVNLAEGGAAPLTGTITVSTDLEAGRSVSISVDGTNIAPVDTAADGSATFAGVSIPEGSDIAVVATGTDTAGNPFDAAGASRTWMIDVTAPTIGIAVPDIVADVMLLADDDADPGTAGMQVDFAVATDEPNASVTLSDAGGAAVAVNADGTGLALFNAFLLAEGTASVTATVTDAVGNSSTTPEYAPIVDSIRPELTITAPTDNFTLNAGNDGDGNLANGLQTTVSVTTTGVEEGEQVCIDSSVEDEIGCALAGAGGVANVPVTFLAEDTHVITARAQDENTNVGTSAGITVIAVTGIYNLTVLTPDLVGGIRGMGADEDTDLGTAGSQTEICVDAGENLLLGTTFVLFVNGADVGATFTPNQTGACATQTFADGTSGTFEVTIADLDGKTGTTGVQNYAVDLAVPAVSITAPTAGAVLNIAADANVAVAGLQFTVAYTTDKAGSLTVLDTDGSVIAGPTDVAAGAGTIQVSDTVEHDAGDWTVRVTDAVGNEGDATVNVTVDVTAPEIGAFAIEVENRRQGLLRAVFTEGGDDGAAGADVVSLEAVATLDAVTNSTDFDAAVALSGSPTEGGPFENVTIGGAATAHTDTSRPLAYDRTWTIAVRAIDDAGNATIVSGTSTGIETVLTIRSPAEDDPAPGDVESDQFGFLSLGSGDLDNDGIDDLVVGSPNEGDDCLFPDFCRGRLRVFRGGATVDGDLALSPAEIIDPGAGTSLFGFLSLSIVESLDGDAFDDVVAYGFAADFSTFLEIYYGQATAPYLDVASSVRLTVPVGSEVLRARVIGDVNNDGNPDLSVTATVGGQTLVYIVFGTGAKLTADVDLTAGGPNIAIVQSTTSAIGRSVAPLGDVTGDGIDDFVVDGAAPDNKLYIVPGRTTWPDSTVPEFVELDGLAGPTCSGECGIEITAGDINGDGRVDLVALDVATTRVFLQDATGAYPTSPSYGLQTGGNTTASARGGLAVSDINGDGFDDIVLTSRENGAHPSGFALFFGDSNVSTTKTEADSYYELPYASGDGANVGACGNLDGSADGLPEFCFGVSYADTEGLDGQVRIRN